MITKPKADRFSNFVIYPNCFGAQGDEIPLHTHPHDHLAVLPGGWVWRVIRMPPGEAVRDEVLDIPPGGQAYVGIPAPWEHKFILLGRSNLPPLDAPTQWCIFSDYDRNGRFLPDPQVTP